MKIQDKINISEFFVFSPSVYLVPQNVHEITYELTVVNWNIWSAHRLTTCLFRVLFSSQDCIHNTVGELYSAACWTRCSHMAKVHFKTMWTFWSLGHWWWTEGIKGPLVFDKSQCHAVLHPSSKQSLHSGQHHGTLPLSVLFLHHWFLSFFNLQSFSSLQCHSTTCFLQ